MSEYPVGCQVHSPVWLLTVRRLLDGVSTSSGFVDTRSDTLSVYLRDQFCSLIFTLSNLYFVGCVYATGIDSNWRRCTTNAGPRWGVAFLLASLPLLARLVQSIRRYVDSGLTTHLINVRECDIELPDNPESFHREASTAPASCSTYSTSCGELMVSTCRSTSVPDCSLPFNHRGPSWPVLRGVVCLRYKLFSLCWSMGVSPFHRPCT